MKMEYFILLVILSLTLFSFGYYMGHSSIEESVKYIEKVTVKTDTITVEKAVPKFYAVTDTVRDTAYVAEYRDSIITLLFHSQSPIDSFSYFSYEILKDTVFVPQRASNSFWDRFSVGIQSGIGYGVFSKKPDVYLGLGINFRIK